MSNDEEQPNAVVVSRVFSEDGDFAVSIETTGDVQQTEIATILALALQRARAGVGL